MKNLIVKFLPIAALIFTSCGAEDYVPKPHGLVHIDLPAHDYQLLNETGKPYSFEYSKFANTENDTTNWKSIKDKYKVIDYTQFGGKVYLTYKEIHNSVDTLNSLIDESYRLAYGHDKMAYGIEDKVMVTTNGNRATMISISGDVPSQYQFFTHDSTQHFLRGALYFPLADKNDSLRPVINYIQEDIHHLINTLVWK